MNYLPVLRGGPPDIECPARHRRVSMEVCSQCGNRIRVQFRSEGPPETQCALWNWDATAEDEGLK
jgi:hypothetical protein